MAFEFSDVKTRVRFMLADDFPTARYPDTTVAFFINDALDEIITRYPNAYMKIQNVAVPAGKFFHIEDILLGGMSGKVVALFDFIANDTAGGNTDPIRAYERSVLHSMQPKWSSEPALDYMRYFMKEDRESFYVYPALSQETQVTAKCTTLHPLVQSTGDTTIELPRLYLNVVADYVISRILLRDSESAPAQIQLSSGYMESFTTQLNLIAGEK